MVEDESYFWTVSRYIHLNPVRGQRPLVAHPGDWRWSSYLGYASVRRRADWVAYEKLLSAWQGEMGGPDARSAYRRFVEAGVTEPPENPFRDAADGWLLGTQRFVDRMRDRMNQPSHLDEVPSARRLANLEPETVLDAVADYYGVQKDTFRLRRSGKPSRDVAAWLARRLTTVTLRELAEPFGLSHPDSISSLVRRGERTVSQSPKLRKDIQAIREKLRS